MSRRKKVIVGLSVLVVIVSPFIFWFLRPSREVQEVSSLEDLFPEITAPEEEPGEEAFSSIRGEYANNSVYADSTRYDKHYLIPSRITDTEMPIRCKLYKSNLETLLEFYDLESRLFGKYDSWEEREEAVNRPVDLAKLSLIQEWEERSEEGKPWVLVSLPMNKVGIYYLKLEHPDLPQPYGVHVVLNRYFLATQLGTTGGVIWALDMSEVKDQPGVKLTFYDLDQGIGKIREGATDEKGLFPISSLEPFSAVDLVVGRYDGDVFLASFGFSKTPEFRAHLETDLPLYKPGDTVRFSGIVWREDKGNFSPVGGKSATARLRCGWGADAVLTEKAIKIKDSIFDTSLVLDKSFSGYCSLTLVLDAEEVQSKSIEVSEYVKPTFEVNAWSHQKEYFPEDVVKFDVEAKHLSGAPIKGKLEWGIRMRNFTESERTEDYDPYDLSSECRWWWGEEEPVSSGQTDLDANGKATVSYQPDITRVRESAALCLSAKVTDLAEESHSAYAGVVVHQGDFKLLVDTVGDWSSRQLPVEGGEVTVSLEIKSLNHRDEPISVAGITGGVYLLRKDDEGNILARQLKGVITVDTDQKGEAWFDYVAGEKGCYEVEVTAEDSKGRLVRGTGTFYVYRAKREEPEPPGYEWSYPGGRIDIRFDQQEDWRGTYEVGNAAKISFYEGGNESTEKLEGRALVAVQTKNKFSYEFRNLEEVFQIPIKLEHVPAFSVSVFMVDEERVIWQGEAWADVADPKQKMLQVEVSSNKSTYGVREQVQISLQLRDNEAKKVPGQVMLSVTDKAVYKALEEMWGGGAVSPDNHPYNTFYDYFNTSVWSSHSLEQFFTFLGGYGAAGGGGPEPERVEFLDTAYWNPRIATDASGTAKIGFELPDNLTTWYIYAVGLTKSVQVGSKVTEIKVYQAVFLDPRLAVSYSVGEEVEIKGTLHNFTEKSRQFNVKLEGEGFEVLEGGSQTKEVGANDTVGLSWKVRIGDVSEAVFKFSATDGEVGDSIQLKRPVHLSE